MTTDDTLRYREMLTKCGRSNEFLRAYRQFKPIVLAGIHLSIQASYHHYCTPRDTFENPSIYTHMELGLVSVYEGDRSWVDLHTDGRLEGFRFKADFKEYEEQTGLFAFIPVEYIELLYKYLVKVEFERATEVFKKGVSQDG
jgi:hypothetical protein